ncbi:unnamed protein product [Cochlearia groenlandica]
METISVQRSSDKQVSGFKNHKRRTCRGSTSRSGGGSLSLPSNPTSLWVTPSPPNHSQPPLPRVNSSTRAKSNTENKNVDYFGSVPVLTRTGSVPVWSNHPSHFPKGFDGYPGPAIMLLSPPPCSLPMPRFSIKPKLRCNAEAACKNDVANENNRRVLHLR